MMYDGFDLGLVTGTGRVGASISSSSPENTFFGNLSYEYKALRDLRRTDGEKYKANKLALNTAVNLVSFKNKNIPIKLNFGITLKRHDKIKRVNYGAGASLMAGPLSAGYSYYHDDHYWDKEPLLNFYIQDKEDGVVTADYGQVIRSTPYIERFKVTTLSLGLKYDFFAMDIVSLQTKSSEFPEAKLKVNIFNSTFIYAGSMITIGRRQVKTNRYFDDITTPFVFDAINYSDWHTLFAYQYSFNGNWLGGILYNYHLNKGFTFILTYFFI